ncbi:MAG: molybdate ABC transporter substrate-binding protein [Coriobacteriia bacterium]|nr:molybdate ABC transporter substrate-binding protein [Coriobacteriia bacterium]
MIRRTFVKGALTAAVAVALGAGGLCLTGCGGSGGSAGGTTSGGSGAGAAQEAVELQIFAANSLEKAMTEVQKYYTSLHPEVTFADSQFKASGDLVEMLVAGAPADILITASSGTMDSAEAFVVPETRMSMFTNDLIVCASEKSKLKINDLKDLKSKKVKKIAVGDPAFVPAGKYANQSLYSAEITGDRMYSAAEGEGGSYGGGIQDKIALADKVGTCAAWAASGNVDVGFIYSSDLYRYEGIKNIYTVPEELHKTIIYPGAVINTSKYQEQAETFLKFCMTDPEALKIWQENGFELK